MIKIFLNYLSNFSFVYKRSKINFMFTVKISNHFLGAEIL